MNDDLLARVRAALDEGKGAAKAGRPYLPVVTLESETVIGVDRDGRWLAVPPEDGQEPRTYGPEREHVLAEVLEWKRRAFDDALEQGAAALGLPADELLVAFPAVELARAMLQHDSAYLVRLALQWLLPSELREARPDIVAVTKRSTLPRPIKELAQRLVVPE